MKIVEVEAREYGKIFAKPAHVYNSVEFAQLNSHKAERLHHLVFDDGGARLGIILGERADGVMYSPFSAPFGGFTTNRPQQFEYFDMAVELLKEYGAGRDKRIVITLPPDLYDRRQIPLAVNALCRHAETRFVDVNYHFDLTDFEHYIQNIERNARNKLNHAMKENLIFNKVERSDSDGAARAYGVIRRNREEQGYPLRMTCDDVMRTAEIIPADFFLLSHGGRDVAAAQVFHVAEGICQLIYWGDLREFSGMRPMNLLAYRVFEHYRKQGLSILDIGPSTEDGVPNYGLCSFKKSIGCMASNKFSFLL